MEVEFFEPFLEIFDELFYKGKKDEEKKTCPECAKSPELPQWTPGMGGKGI